MNLNLENAVRYHDGQFPPGIIDYPRIMGDLLAATDALARYDQMLKGLHNSEVFLAPLRNQEAVISSRMEGTISTMDEILKLDPEFDESAPADGDVRSEIVETILYQRSLRTAQHNLDRGYPLSPALIKGIHQQLLSFGRGAKKSPGAFKREQNYVGEHGSGRVSFIPISPEKLNEGMERLFEVVHDEKLPVLLRAAICHLEFEALHPFEDGNGRVGRMLITLMLWKYGAIEAPHFYISRYFEDHKAEYIRQMRNVSEHGTWDEWCQFFLTAVKEQAINNLYQAEHIRSLYEDMKTRFAALLSSKWSVKALDFMFTTPVFRNSRFTHNSGIPAPTAARFSRLLLKEGLLEIVEEAAGQKPATFRFEPLVNIVRV